MKKNMKKFLFFDVIILIFLFLLSSTNLSVKEKKRDIYRIAVLTDMPHSRQLENFYLGVIKSSEHWNVDISFVNLSDFGNGQEKKAELQKELDNGCRSVILQCKNIDYADEMLSIVPIGVPVVLYNSEAVSARIRVKIGIDFEEESRLLSEAILKGRQKEENVTIIDVVEENQYADKLHELTEERLKQAGVPVKRIEIEEHYADTLVKGMTAQGGNILVSCDLSVLQALGSVNGQGFIPIYGAGICKNIQDTLEKKSIYGTIVHRDYEAGYMAVEQAARILSGNGAEEVLTIESAFVTSETLFEKETESIVFPYI
ncbi:hypothetical protein IMSAG049_00441 [Clostridiales bacterium]|nr:hypothetical protein IMSAG049_00441 [Clostridiales bacterium]